MVKWSICSANVCVNVKNKKETSEHVFMPPEHSGTKTVSEVSCFLYCSEAGYSITAPFADDATFLIYLESQPLVTFGGGAT